MDDGHAISNSGRRLENDDSTHCNLQSKRDCLYFLHSSWCGGLCSKLLSNSIFNLLSEHLFCYAYIRLSKLESCAHPVGTPLPAPPCSRTSSLLWPVTDSGLWVLPTMAIWSITNPSVPCLKKMVQFSIPVLILIPITHTRHYSLFGIIDRKGQNSRCGRTRVQTNTVK